MGILIELIIVLVILAVIGYAALYVIRTFSLPDPVKMLVGAVLLIAVLIYAAALMGVGGGQRGPLFWGR